MKHTGVGIMASSPSAVSTVTAKLAILRELAGGDWLVRVGINADEPIAEDDDLFGTAVQLASPTARSRGRCSSQTSCGSCARSTHLPAERDVGSLFTFRQISRGLAGFGTFVRASRATA